MQYPTQSFLFYILTVQIPFPHLAFSHLQEKVDRIICKYIDFFLLKINTYIHTYLQKE